MFEGGSRRVNGVEGWGELIPEDAGANRSAMIHTFFPKHHLAKNANCNLYCEYKNRFLLSENIYKIIRYNTLYNYICNNLYFAQ